MKKDILNIFSFILLVVVSSCNGPARNELKMATSSQGATYYHVGSGIASVLEKSGKFRVNVLSGPEYNTIYNCQKLTTGEVDLAFAQNDTPIENIFTEDGLHDPGRIRTVIPIYPEVIFIIYPDSVEPTSIRDLIIGRRIGIGPEMSGTARFMKNLFLRFGIDTTQYTPVYTPFSENLLSNDKIDISCAVTGINNSRILHILVNEGGRVLSLDDLELANRGSAVDGFCLNYPRARPFIIPKNTFGKIPIQPVLTVAVDAVLLTHEGVDPYQIYDIVEEIYQNTQTLSNDNTLFGQLTQNFDAAKLNFPMHEGVKRYLERNQPSFIERYAELVGVVFSIVVVILGAMSSLQKNVNRKKMVRINDLYTKVIKFETEFEEEPTKDRSDDIIEKLEVIKREAFLSLKDEKLKPDESFRIFVNLANEAIDRIRHRVIEEAV